MKSTLMVAALVAASLSTPALAQVYIGGSVGQADHHQNKNDWSGGAGFSTTYDNTDTAYKLFGGYKFNRNFAIEGGYTDLGKYTARITGGGDTGDANVKTTSWSLFAVGIVPVGESFSLFGKAGLSRNRSKMNFSSGGVAFLAADGGSHSDAEFALGLGGSFAFTRQLAVRLELEDLGKAGKTNNGFTIPGRTSDSRPRLWSIGLQYGF